MKQILLLILVLTLLLALNACGKDKEPDPTVGQTTVTTDPPVTTQPPHTHNYTSEVTAEPSCTEDGTCTFTCSCGDSYTEAIPADGHVWGQWEIETNALVGKPGSEKRSCSVCSESETQERTANAIANSFYDGGLQHIIASHYGSINATSLLSYACHEFHEYLHKPVASETIFTALSERFNITEQLKADMIQLGKDLADLGIFGYDAANDTFNLQYNAEVATLTLLGYVHVEGKQYRTYYTFTPFDIDATLTFEVTLEYNKLDGKPNKYFSVQRCDEVPADMIPCAEGERSEFIG